MTRADHDGDVRGARSLRGELRARARHSYVPLSAFLELTKTCNLRCVHCYVSRSEARETSIPRLIQLVAELADLGCFSVALTGGEVGLREGWLDVAAEVKLRRMTLTVLTNGTVFSATDVQALIGLRPALVSVSLYGATAETHDRVTRVDGSFARTVDTVRKLRAAGIACRISSVLLPETVDNMRAISHMADELGCRFMFDPSVAPGDDGSCDVLTRRIDADRLLRFYLEDFILPRSKVERLARAETEPQIHPTGNCDAGMTSLFVDAHGDVLPCMGFPPPFGNIADSPLAEIWRSPVAGRHREAMLAPLHMCQDCTLLPYCSARCPRLASIEDGDMSGPSSRACDIARITVEMREQLREGAESPDLTALRGV